MRDNSTELVQRTREIANAHLVHSAKGLQAVPLGASDEAACLTILVVVVCFLLLHLGVFVCRVGNAQHYHSACMLVSKVDALRHLQQQQR